MSQTIVISSKTVGEILSSLNTLTNEIKEIKTRLFGTEPKYGSDAWWQWSNREALKEIKAGKGIKIHNKKELNAFFNNLKTA